MIRLTACIPTWFLCVHTSRKGFMILVCMSLFACGADDGVPSGPEVPPISPSPQPTQSPVTTPVSSATPTPISTPVPTSTPVSIPSSIATPVPSASPSPTALPSQSPTLSPSPSPVPTREPTPPPLLPVSLSSKITKVQPMTGIVLWADSHNTSQLKRSDEFIQLEYAYVKPSDIVNGEGEYNWAALESLLDAVSGRGHQAILRWYYVYPGSETEVPDVIKKLPDYSETKGQTEGKNTYFPDWSHASLRHFHLDFYSEFARRYDDDPRIAFLQVGFGLWGEYHIYDGPNTIGEQFPSKAFQRQFVAHLEDVFTQLHWSISIDAGDSYYSPFANDSALRGANFGLFDDSFMHKTHADYNQDMWTVFGHGMRYQHSPHGGELSYYSDYDQQNVLNVSGIYGRTYEALSAQYHISYMIGNDQPSHQSHQRIKQAGMANGYKFTITEFVSSVELSRITVENTGIAPIYYPAFISVNGVRANESLHHLQPGQKQTYTVSAGGHSPAPSLSIESDRLVDGQQIQFEASL